MEGRAPNAAPFVIGNKSRTEGVCHVSIVAKPETVNLVFQRVFSQAVAEAQHDLPLHQAVDIPTGQRIPDEVVLRYYRPSIYQSIKDSLAKWAIRELHKREGMRTLDTPVVEVGDLQFGKPVIIEADCFLLPKIDLCVLEGLSLQRTPISVVDEDIDRAIEELRRVAAEAEAREEIAPARMGDRLEVDFESCLGGAPLLLGSFSSGYLELRPDSPLSVMCERFVGARAGEIVSFEVASPGLEDSIDVRARIRQIEAVHLPDIDDALAHKMGAKSLVELTNLLKGHLQERLLLIEQARMLTKVVDHVAQRHAIDVPEVLVRRQFAQQLQAVLSWQAERGISPRVPGPEEVETLFQRSKKVTSRQTKARLIIAGLTAAANIEVSINEVRVWALKQWAELGLPREKLSKVLDSRVRLRQLRQRLVQSRLLDVVVK